MTFQSFDSFDDAMEAMRVAEARANAQVTMDQSSIGYGDCWVSAFEDFLIFGRVHTLEELDATEKELGVNARERKEEQAMIESAHARGYRFGTAYSMLEPTGELGSTHISRMVPINETQLNLARGHDWDVRALLGCEECRPWIRRVILDGAGR